MDCAGIALLIGFFASYLTALSWADLTFVLPATAFGNVIVALLSQLLAARADLTGALGGDCADHDRRGVCRARPIADGTTQPMTAERRAAQKSTERSR